MKRHKILLISILIIIQAFLTNVFASHYMGGEITWECIPSGNPDAGKFIFTLVTYRECGGITFGATQTINSNSPAGNITVGLEAGYPKDISPVCNSNYANITCASTTVSNTGGISEYKYKSNPIQIVGIPPASGWIFSWTDCCRNPCTNIQNSSAMNWYLKSTMFPLYNNNLYPCYDNSPTFAEKPISVISAGYPFTYNAYSSDKELDSLVYSWAQPLTNQNSPISSYNPGYSYSSPFPSLMHNQLNVPAVLDPGSGDMTFTSYTTGAFLFAINVESFKNGVKVAEVMREFQMVILLSTPNMVPEMLPPFYNNAGQWVDFSDTVMAGELVNFTVSFTDFDFLPNATPQLLQAKARGYQFGNYIPANGSSNAALSTTDCVNPPCATLNPPFTSTIPLQVQFGFQSFFSWQTECSHLVHVPGFNNRQLPYYFHFSAFDDYCPTPAQNNKTITIVVKDRSVRNPRKCCVNTNSDGSVDLNWQVEPDLMNVFRSYKIYKANQSAGPYVLLDSLTSINTNYYTDPNANAINYQRFYKVITNYCGCFNPYDHVDNLPFRSVFLTVSLGSSYSNLYWNPPYHNAQILYYIFAKDNLQNWTLIDSTYQNSYHHIFSGNIPASYKLKYKELIYSDPVNFQNCNAYSNEAMNVVNSIYENDESIMDFTIFPNPSSEDFKLEFIGNEENKCVLEVFAIDGKMVKQIEISGQKSISINLDGRVGVFQLVVTNQAGQKVVKRLVKI